MGMSREVTRWLHKLFESTVGIVTVTCMQGRASCMHEHRPLSTVNTMYYIELASQSHDYACTTLDSARPSQDWRVRAAI